MNGKGMVPEMIENVKPIFRQQNIAVAYLFGSRALGFEHQASDYDLGLLFKDYCPARHNIVYRLNLAEELAVVLGAPVDVVFLQSAPILMRYEVIATGRVIYCIDEDFRTDFEDIALRDYLDFKPFIDQYHREVAEAIKDGYFFAEP
ncbi:MAG: type VII toxin-antitoxin system MntA family adenylyltransferase antitoxin [Bacillota bacterium]